MQAICSTPQKQSNCSVRHNTTVSQEKMMNPIRKLFSLCLLFSALSANADDSPALDASAKQNLITDPSGKEYFPKKYDNWYRPHLRAMGEPSIYSEKGPELLNEFRFLYLPTFSKPISLRGFRADGRFFIRVVRLTGKGGYDPGKVEIGVNVQVTEEEWKGLEDSVVQSFKEKPLTDEQRSLISGLDGSQWILEARIDGKYHFEEAPQAGYWTSKEGIEVLKKLEKEGMDVPILFKFVDACKMFLSLTDFTLPSRMVPAQFTE